MDDNYDIVVVGAGKLPYLFICRNWSLKRFFTQVGMA